MLKQSAARAAYHLVRALRRLQGQKLRVKGKKDELVARVTEHLAAPSLAPAGL